MKICPACGDEFEDWADSCPDCEMSLRWEHEMPSLPDSIAGVCVGTGSERSLRPVSAALRAAGIATRIARESLESGLGFELESETLGIGVTLDGWTHCLYAASQDAVKAEEIASRLLGSEADLPQPIELVEGECPACGAPVPEEATECPDCSLVLVVADSGAGSDARLPDLGFPATDVFGLPVRGSGQDRK